MLPAFVAVLVYIMGFILILADFYVPSAGLLAILGLGGIGYGIYFAFHANVMAGYTSLGLAFVFLPLIVRTGLNRLALRKELRNEDGYIGVTERKDLEGKEGVALSSLRPAGLVKIENERVDAVSDGKLIDKGDKIKVLRVEGNKIIVRKI